MAKSSVDFTGEYPIGDAVLYIKPVDSKTWTATLRIYKGGRKYEATQEYKTSRLEGVSEATGIEIIPEYIHADLVNELKEVDDPIPGRKLNSLRDAIRERLYGRW